MSGRGKANVPRGTYPRTLAGDAAKVGDAGRQVWREIKTAAKAEWRLFWEHRKIWFSLWAGGVIVGMLIGTLWAGVVKAHAYRQTTEPTPPACLRTTEIRNGVERDLGCEKGTWRYGYRGDRTPGKTR